MGIRTSLANHLLIASPMLRDPTFAHTVIYVCEDHPQGTVGLIINRPLQYSLKFVFDQLHLKSENKNADNMPLLFGGPLQAQRGFVMHREPGAWLSSMVLLPNEVNITTSSDIIRALAHSNGPDVCLVALGYVGWEQAQLDHEINQDSWIVCPFSAELLYDVPFENRWEAAGLSIGVKMNQLIFGVGHA